MAAAGFSVMGACILCDGCLHPRVNDTFGTNTVPTAVTPSSDCCCQTGAKSSTTFEVSMLFVLTVLTRQSMTY